MKVAISVENLYASYRNRVVIKDIFFSVKENSFFAIVGPNGAGKTTLLLTILGVKKIDSGKIKLFGEEISSKNIRKWRKAIGYVPQNVFIQQKFPISVYETVLTGRIGKKFLKKLDKEDIESVEWAMEKVGIKDLKNRPIGHLSGGEMRKVFIARALCQKPAILLMDEPASNLDPSSCRSLMELIEELYYESKITTIFVTHLTSLIPDFCDGVIFIKDGTLLFQGKKEDVLSFYSKYRIEDAGAFSI